MIQIVLATTNDAKAREFVGILGETVDIIVPGDLPFVAEDGETLLENAYKKARSAADHLGYEALADDSGLFVDALGGSPGVHSARFAGPDSDDAANRSKLLAMLEDIGDRTAHFETVLCLCAPGAALKDSQYFEGRCEGRIIGREKGAHGFGYDPIFVPSEGDGRTFGEMTANEKSELSHRSKAISRLKDFLLETAG
ncbi:MAG: RdgB/HAM1 family non-canonical purine NTP pyrophosphatase [Actinomycetota bacterium]|nr:MAG: RdgB/HAM1 family non-canonical purine NTP pyrophosphatase [Actinomycetota bacterium]